MPQDTKQLKASVPVHSSAVSVLVSIIKKKSIRFIIVTLIHCGEEPEHPRKKFKEETNITLCKNH